MLIGEPFITRSGIHVPGRIHDSVLNLILKLRVTHREGKREIHRFLLQLLFLVDVFYQFNLLLILE